MNNMPALNGVRVIDLTRTLAGLFSTMILGDLGAEVIKHEPREVKPNTLGRFVVSSREVDKIDMRTIQTFRNKKSLILDLHKPQGQEVFYDLVRVSDVVINNYRPGVMEALEIGYEKLSGVNPRIIYASITGFGTSGPYAPRPSYDYIAQAFTGMMSRTGELGGHPLFPGVPVADMGTGMFAAHGILAALYARGHTGLGQKVDACLLDTCLAFLCSDGCYTLNRGYEPPPYGTKHWALPLPGIYQTADGYVTIAPISQDQTCRLIQAVGRGDLLEQPEFCEAAGRLKNRRRLQALVEESFRTQPTAYWLEALEKADIPHSPVNTMSQAFTDPHVKGRGMVIEFPYDGRTYKAIASPIRMSGFSTRYNPPPKWGEHTQEILTGILGYSPQRIEALKQNEVI